MSTKKIGFLLSMLIIFTLVLSACKPTGGAVETAEPPVVDSRGTRGDR